MTRTAVLALAGVAAVGAAALGPSAPLAREGAYASLGALRPLAVDALFLRADALRRRGRYEEVVSLYRRILEVEPGSEDARDFLAATEAYDLRPASPTEAGRVQWFRGALALVEEGIARDPASARLRWRAADLLVRVPDGDDAVAADLRAAGRDRLAEAMGHLRVAATVTDSLPRLGFEHLDDAVALVPRVAAERLADGGPGVDEALEVGEELLRLRADALARFHTSPALPLTADAQLRAGLNLVRFVARALADDPPRRDEALDLLETYEDAVGPGRVGPALRRLLR